MTAPREHSVEGAEGVPIHVVEWSREGVPFVLLHGFGNEARVWDDLVPHLAPFYRVIALDLRGHGDSGRDPEQRYDYPWHVRDLENVNRALGIERLVLCGHSLGGRIATFFAAEHVAQMAGLVLVDSGPDLDARGTSRIRADTQRESNTRIESVAGYERQLARAYPAAKPDVVARLARHGLRQLDAGGYERKLDPFFHGARAALDQAQMAARDREISRRLWEALAAIPCPTLVVRGAASDVLSPECADRMVEEALPDGRLAVVPRASHSVMLDNPAGFAEAVCAFALG